MTFGEYRKALKGYKKKQLDTAFYTAMAFNKPEKLNEIRMMDEAIERKEGKT